MVTAAEILTNKKDTPSAQIIEEMNYYEIEIKLCELDLEKIVQKQRYNSEVMKRVDYFRNQFKRQLTDCENIIHKSRQLWLLTDQFRFHSEWKKGNLYQTLQKDLFVFRNHQTELLFEFEAFVNA